LFSSSDSWIKKGLVESPGFLLATHGYDVWFGNNRGNLYSHSNNHVNSFERMREFHDFSFAELGLFDLPAQLDKAREVSGQDKVTYIGHS
jgi:predicted alpha/beta hydrolase